MLTSISPSAATARRERDGFSRAPTLVRLLPERRLHVLRVLEVRDERRAHLDEQRLQLRVLGVGDERLVDGIEDGLVIFDFVIDVRLVERPAAQRLEVGDI